MKKYIPNALTTYRLLVSLLLLPLYLSNFYNILIYLFISAIITDLLDGILARKWNVVSTYGKIADIIGDKLLSLFATLIFILSMNKIYIITLILEAIISLINIVKCFKSGSIKTRDFSNHESSIYGKIKTWFLFIALSFGILSFKFDFFKKLVNPFVILTAIAQIIAAIDYAKPSK